MGGIWSTIAYSVGLMLFGCGCGILMGVGKKASITGMFTVGVSLMSVGVVLFVGAIALVLVGK